jgi:hypothetical protein
VRVHQHIVVSDAEAEAAARDLHRAHHFSAMQTR